MEGSDGVYEKRWKGVMVCIRRGRGVRVCMRGCGGE